MANWQDQLNEFRRQPAVQQLLSKTAEAMCAPFWWSLRQDPKKPAKILRNGTITYVNTGTAELGLTADHVLEKYLLHLIEYGEKDLECQFGGSTISPEKRIKAKHSAWDIASLSVPEVFITAAYQATRMQYNAVQWPPTRVEAGELVIYGGYPGIEETRSKSQISRFSG
jgi:hypothetical protein